MTYPPDSEKPFIFRFFCEPKFGPRNLDRLHTMKLLRPTGKGEWEVDPGFIRVFYRELDRGHEAVVDFLEERMQGLMFEGPEEEKEFLRLVNHLVESAGKLWGPEVLRSDGPLRPILFCDSGLRPGSKASKRERDMDLRQWKRMEQLGIMIRQGDGGYVVSQLFGRYLLDAVARRGNPMVGPVPKIDAGILEAALVAHGQRVRQRVDVARWTPLLQSACLEGGLTTEDGTVTQGFLALLLSFAPTNAPGTHERTPASTTGDAAYA